MFCIKCGKELSQEARFCAYCGQAVQKPEPVVMLCPNCGREFDEDKIYCETCGYKLQPKGRQHTAKLQSKKPQIPIPVPKPAVQPKPTPQPQPITQAAPMVLNLMSQYVGEPSVGVAKATGKLSIYPDRMVFDKQMGNALGNAFGLVGMLAAQKKAQKEGKQEIYLFSDLAWVKRGKYAGTMPTLVIGLKTGEVFSFAGGALTQSIDRAIAAINVHI